MLARSRRYGLGLIAAAGVVVACADNSPTESSNSPLAGMSRVDANDSSVTPPPTDQTPGYFHGTVLGPSEPGAGNDSLATAPRIANVRVTIYPRVGASLPVEVGPEAGSVLTGADGKFQLPTLPPGEYVVTFVPPANSIYSSVYAFGPLRSNSEDYPWWVVLPRK